MEVKNGEKKCDQGQGEETVKTVAGAQSPP
jgi:hypothetical protein